MKKLLCAAPASIQRMMLKLQKYDATVVHCPGKDIPLADTLSRKFLENNDSSISDCADVMVHMVMTILPSSDVWLRELPDALQKDLQVQALCATILSGEPDARKECPAYIQEYWNHCNVLSMMRGLIFRGDYLVIPKVLKSNMMQQIHHGHMGMDKCKECVRGVLFWSGMNRQTEETVSKCIICIEARRANAKEPMLAHEVPDRPCQTVATDLFLMDGETYIVIVDYYSGYTLRLNSYKMPQVPCWSGKQRQFSPGMGYLRRSFRTLALSIRQLNTPGLHNNGVSSISHPALITHSLMDWLRSMCKVPSACSWKQRTMRKTHTSAFWSIETLQLMV